MPPAGRPKSPGRPGPRKLPQQERSRALFDAVLEAARLAIDEHGEEFTLAQVAKRAGVSPGSFYQYFPDRAALVGALLDEQIKTDRQRLRELAPVLLSTPPDHLPRIIVDGVLQLYGEHPRLMSCLVRLTHELGRTSDLEIAVAEFSQLLATALSRGREDLSPQACRLAMTSAISAILGMVRQAAETHPTLMEDVSFKGRLEAVCRAALDPDR